MAIAWVEVALVWDEEDMIPGDGHGVGDGVGVGVGGGGGLMW